MNLKKRFYLTKELKTGCVLLTVPVTYSVIYKNPISNHFIRHNDRNDTKKRYFYLQVILEFFPS